MTTNKEQKRLKKEYKVIRGTYTVRVPDDISFERAKERIDGILEGFERDDHTMFAGWKERK
jgi:hypothetical protein